MKWVNRWSTIPTIYTYVMQIIDEFRKCLKRSKDEAIPLKDILVERRWFFLMKFSEFPVSRFLQS